MEILLNAEQRDTLAWFFDTRNEDGEPWLFDEPGTIEVDRGQLVLNGCYLHRDGEWATFHEEDQTW